jgi:hypothetical protein
MEKNQKLVWVAAGMLDAEMIKAFLSSFEINATLYQESVGAIYGMNFGTLGEVKIYVPTSQVKLARQVLKDYENGNLEENNN